MTAQKLLTPEQVAEELNLSVRTVKDWLREGKLKGVKIGTRGDWRVRENDLEWYKKSGTCEPLNPELLKEGSEELLRQELEEWFSFMRGMNESEKKQIKEMVNNVLTKISNNK